MHNILFAFLPVWMPVCVCESMIVLVSAFMCTCMCTGSCRCPAGHMNRASATEGGQLSSFVRSMGHHLIPVQSRDQDRASETTVSNCSLSVRQMGGRGSYVGGVLSIHAGGLYISIPAVWIYNKIQMLMILNAHLFPDFLFFFFPLSVWHSISARSSSVVQHKTLCSYYRVSRACKSLWGLPWQLQAQPGAPYLGLSALDVSLGTQRHGGGRLEG